MSANLTSRTKRLTDQVLILESVKITREEMAEASLRGAGDIEMNEIYGRLAELYACLDTDKIVAALKEEKDYARQAS